MSVMNTICGAILAAACFVAIANADPKRGKPDCVAGGQSETNHPHETYCDKYYVCAPNGTLSLSQCPPTYMFSTAEEQCTIPGAPVVDCSHRPYSDPTYKKYQNPPRPLCQPGSPLQYHPHEYYCDHYYKCEDGVESMGVCPPREILDQRQRRPDELKCTVDRGELYNAEFHCVPNPLRLYPENGTCPRNEKRMVADSTDCGVYWSCDNGDIKVKSCFGPDVFDPSSQESYPCKLPEKVEGLAERKCSMKNVIPNMCPKNWYEWTHSKYVQPALAPWWVHTYIARKGIKPLTNPRFSYGHCRFFFECILEDGQYLPKIAGCYDATVLEPNTLQCVDASLVPQCQYYRSNYQLLIAYESRLRNGRF